MLKITLKDPSLKSKKYDLTPRVQKLKDAYFRAMPEICVERPLRVTNESHAMGLFDKDKISILDKARLYRKVLEEKEPIITQRIAYEKGKGRGKPKKFHIRGDSLFAGATTSKFKGVPLYPEFMAMTLWPELWNISTRKSNPFYLDKKDAETLNFEVFPYWMDSNINELARKFSYDEQGKKEAPEMGLMELLVFFIDTKPNCISHTIPDMDTPIKDGLRKIINRAKRKRSRARNLKFYDALVEVLEGVIAYSNNLADEAERLASVEKDAKRRKEFRELADIHRRVPEGPATTFREGLTTLWTCWTALHIENPNIAISLGRMDQYLYKLYRDDIRKKRINVKDALELLCCLWLKIGDHVPCIPEAGEKLFGGSGSNQAITIGGVDKKGKDAVNDLTYVILKSIELMQLRDPNLNARYYPRGGKKTKDYLRRLSEVNFKTGATPAVHNDRTIIQALTRRGVSLADARDYGVIGCVEPVSSGRTYGHTGAVMVNLTSVLELTLFNGRHRHTSLDRRFNDITPPPSELATFKDFKAAFTKQAKWLIKKAVHLNNIYGKVHQRYYPTPVMSAFFEGPMDKGKDVIEGGAKINSSGAAIVGLADTADCLSAIEYLVYEKREYALEDIIEAVKNNFKGQAALQKRLMNPEKMPKYGNDFMDENGRPYNNGNENVAFIIKLMDKTFNSLKNYRGGRYRTGYWTMTNHAGFGRMMGASPSGRKDRDNFTSGITPVSGVTPCLTAMLNSVAGVPTDNVTSGMAFNIKYTPPRLNGDEEEMIDMFSEYMEGYFKDRKANGGKAKPGGMEIQFNVTDRAKFLRAVKKPEKYSKLLVRVSGYTAYFKDLNPQMQMEIINRTEYDLKKKKAVSYKPYRLPKKQTCPIKL